jgi:serine/threonine protein kinase
MTPDPAASGDEDSEDPFAPRARTADPLLLPGEAFDVAYRVEAIIGDGGTALVARATHPKFGRVAIKLLRPEHAKDAHVVDRFLVEARLVARVKSVNVVTVYDVSTTQDGRPYFAMELLDGMDLATLLEGHGRLPIDDSIRYAAEAAIGLAGVHALGLVHRDVKPENLFLAKTADGIEEIKLVDFGIVRVLDQAARAELGVKATEGIVGTPRYMAPEQVQEDLAVDGRADIWALGCVLYEMLTGKCVFDGRSFVESLRNVLMLEPPPPSVLRPEVPAEVDAIVKRCLAKSADERFSSASELASALEAALRSMRTSAATAPLVVADPPLVIDPPSRSEPMARSMRAGARGSESRKPPSSLGPTGRTISPQDRNVERAKKMIGPLAVLAVSSCAVLAYVLFTHHPRAERSSSIAPGAIAATATEAASGAPASATMSAADVSPSSAPTSDAERVTSASASVSASAAPSASSKPIRKSRPVRRDPSSVL